MLTPDDRQQRIAAEAERLERDFPHAVDAEPAGRRDRWGLSADQVVKVLAFVGAACAVIAQSEAVPDLLRYCAAALAAGCSAVLALSRSPGQPRPPEAGGRG